MALNKRNFKFKNKKNHNNAIMKITNGLKGSLFKYIHMIFKKKLKKSPL